MIQRLETDGTYGETLIPLRPSTHISSFSGIMPDIPILGGGSPIIAQPEITPTNTDPDMSILRKIGQGLGRLAPVVATGIGGPALGVTVGAVGASLQRPQPPLPPRVVRTGSGTGSMIPSLAVPGTSFFAPSGPSLPRPPVMPSGPTAPPTRPTFGGPGFSQTAAVTIVGRFLSMDMLRRLASLAQTFAAGLGFSIGIDALLEMFNSPFDVLPQDSRNFLQQFAQSNEFAQFRMMLDSGGDPRCGPMVLPAATKTIKDAPRGYVIVVDPTSGQEVAMRKDVARARGLWKAPTKPPISAREWKSAMSFKRVQKKLDKYYKLTAPKTRTVFRDAKSKRCK